MPYGITMPSGSSDFPAFTPAEADILTRDGCKAELIWVMVICQDIVYPRKTVTYLRNNQAVS